MLEWLRLYALLGLDSPILVADAIVHHCFQQFTSLEKIHTLVKTELECLGWHLEAHKERYYIPLIFQFI